MLPFLAKKRLRDRPEDRIWPETQCSSNEPSWCHVTRKNVIALRLGMLSLRP